MPRIIDDRETLDSLDKLLARVGRGRCVSVSRFAGPNRLPRGRKGPNIYKPYHARAAERPQRVVVGDAAGSLPASAVSARGERVSGAAGEEALGWRDVATFFNEAPFDI